MAIRIVAACLLTIGCGADSHPIPSAVNALPPSDSRYAGQIAFFYETWGTEALDTWPPVDFLLQLQASEPAVFGNQFASFGFIPDEHDDLPLGLKRGTADPSKIHETCGLCHVGRLPDGSLYIGLPNVMLDVEGFRVAVDDRWVAAGHPSMIVDRAKELAMGPGRTNVGSDSYPTAVPADFPNYFTLSQRTALNYLGTGVNVRSEACFSLYSGFGAGEPNPETAKVQFPAEDKLDAFLAFFGTIQTPAAPLGDPQQIARGQEVFTVARCGTCHHVGDIDSDGVTPIDSVDRYPGDDPNWPNGSIATDLAHRSLIDDPMGSPGDMGYVDLLTFAGTHGLGVRVTDGYRVNDLRGLWATAPYLHNGSVPTLESLLAADRPTTWMRGGFAVDTTQSGNGNQGHLFGTELEDDDKAALVAYLRSL